MYGRTRFIIPGVVALIAVLAGAVISGWFLFHGSDDNSAASPDFTTVPTVPGRTGTQTEGRSATPSVTTVTVSASPAVTAESGPVEMQIPAEPTDPSSGTGTLACDGRGVLIVNSVMGNSPDFDGEIRRSREQNPGAVVLPPGTCPSLRSYDDNGVAVYAVVLDYGRDVTALCAADVPGVRNARILGNGTPYNSSPC